MLAILNSLNAHNFPIFDAILMILVLKSMLHRVLPDKKYLSLELLSPFNTFANRANPDQAALIRSAFMENDIADPILVELTSNFFVLCTTMKVYLYNYS